MLGVGLILRRCPSAASAITPNRKCKPFQTTSRAPASKATAFLSSYSRVSPRRYEEPTYNEDGTVFYPTAKTRMLHRLSKIPW